MKERVIKGLKQDFKNHQSSIKADWPMMISQRMVASWLAAALRVSLPLSATP